MREPIPPDVVDRIHLDFGNNAHQVVELLSSYREWGAENYLGDRMLRCIVYLSKGDISLILPWIALQQSDYRDLIIAAEYDRHSRQLRNFNCPFGTEEIPN